MPIMRLCGRCGGVHADPADCPRKDTARVLPPARFRSAPRRRGKDNRRRYQREELTPEMRRRVIAESGRHCAKCGTYAPDGQIDHIVPRAEGGAANDIDNLQWLCLPDHRAKTAEDNKRMRARRMSRKRDRQREERQAALARLQSGVLPE